MFSCKHEPVFCDLINFIVNINTFNIHIVSLFQKGLPDTQNGIASLLMGKQLIMLYVTSGPGMFEMISEGGSGEEAIAYATPVKRLLENLTFRSPRFKWLSEMNVFTQNVYVLLSYVRYDDVLLRSNKEIDK